MVATFLISDKFANEHPIVCLMFIGLTLIFLGWLDYRKEDKPFWFIWKWGLASVLFSFCLAYSLLILGFWRWPIAATALGAEICLIRYAMLRRRR